MKGIRRAVGVGGRFNAGLKPGAYIRQSWGEIAGEGM
jgi:hypothetical protein